VNQPAQLRTRERNLQFPQFFDLFGDCGGVPREGSVVLYVENHLFVMEVIWVWQVVCGEGKLKGLARGPSGGELTESKLDDDQARGLELVLNCGIYVVCSDVHPLRKDGRSIRSLQTLFSVCECV